MAKKKLKELWGEWGGKGGLRHSTLETRTLQC